MNAAIFAATSFFFITTHQGYLLAALLLHLAKGAEIRKCIANQN